MQIASNIVQPLMELHSSHGSGIFRIERASVKKQLVVKEGRLVFAESNVPQEHLAKIMVALNLLPKNSLKEITALMKSGKTSEAAIFEDGHADAPNVKKGRHEQALVIIASTLEWTNAAMRFFPGDNLVPYQLNLNLALPELLGEAARRAVKHRRMAFSPEQLDGDVVLLESLHRKGMPFPLNKEEFFACSLLSEKMRTADLISLIPTGEASPEELLMRLMILGIIKFEPKPSSDSESNTLILEIEEMLQHFETASAYNILSVKTDADLAEIQAAYHELAKRFHPDRFQSKGFSAQDRAKAERVFTFINAAYSTLRNPASRAIYDETRLAKESKVVSALKAKTAAKSEEEAQVEALFREGRQSLAGKNFEKAVEQLKSCVWLRPKKANYNYYLGLAESQLPGLLKSAEQHFLKAIELESMSADSHLELAKLYMKVMLPRKAEIQLQEVLRWDPGNAEANNLLSDMENLEKSQTSPLRWKR
jgi:curved DNA-binding protein CbpA